MNTPPFRTSESFSLAWMIFTKNITLLIVCAISYAGLSAGLSYLASEILVDRTSLAILVHIIQYFVTAYLSAGFTVVSLKLVDKQPIRYSDFFSNLEYLLPFSFTQFLYIVSAIIGLVLLVIPGLILLVAFAFYDFNVVDKRLSPFSALKASASLTKGARWRIAWFFVLIALINVLGMLAFGVGFLVSLPISWIAKAHVYRKLSETRVPY